MFTFRNFNLLTKSALASLLIVASFTQNLLANENYDRVKAIVNDSAPDLISIFKQFHKNPELGFEEFETAKTIATKLKAMGYRVKTGVGVTGVVSVFENGPGPVVLFRSDMDALPVKELTNIEYASTKTVKNKAGIIVPVMHGCGHDAHATWLIGIAKVMMELKDQWSGTLILVAQPAEELLSGADAMFDDGMAKMMPAPDFIIAGHQMPIWPKGSVALAGGYRTAGSIQMDVTINGKGGHGSMPHLTIDPVLMGSQAVLAYQTIVSRIIDQSKPAVLTVGAFQSGNANNVISDSAILKLNLRWYDPSVRDLMVNKIKEVTDNIARMYGVDSDNFPTYVIKSDVPPVFADHSLALRAKIAMQEILGDNKVFKTSPRMGSEDFHLLAGRNSKAKVMMIEVGSGPLNVLADMKAGKMPVYPHNPYFYMDTEAVLYGTKALSAVLLDLLGSESSE